MLNLVFENDEFEKVGAQHHYVNFTMCWSGTFTNLEFSMEIEREMWNFPLISRRFLAESSRHLVTSGDMGANWTVWGEFCFKMIDCVFKMTDLAFPNDEFAKGRSIM